MTPLLAILADLLVAVLLVATIVTSLALGRRIARMKADETSMRGTIADLVAATQAAERAIGGLRATLGDCDRTLVDRLRTAERYAADLGQQVQAGEVVMNRIAQIVDASRQVAGITSQPEPQALAPSPTAAKGERLGAAAAAAQALADRIAKRLESRAA